MEQARAVPTAMPKWLALGVVAVLMGLVLRAAWVTEDAYITLRSIDNWVNGYGPRWNIDERVQAYTHPLWMLILSALYVVTREGFLTAIVAGLGTTLVAALVLVRNARSSGHAIAALGFLVLSRSFVEFSTSGLENPLTHVLVAQFVWVYAVRRDPLRPICLSAALITLNRTDALLVALPALAHAFWVEWRARGTKITLREAAIGFSPLFAWLAFSLFYYGFLVPNTAFAKLNTGLPKVEVLRQGLTYLLNAVAWDPPTTVTITIGLVIGFAYRQLRHALLSVGVLLYLIYIVEIGGDFMLGRFMTLPLYLAALLVAISELPLDAPPWLAAFALPQLALFFHPAATERYPVGDFHYSGIADERTHYREGAGLMYFTRTRGLPNHPWASQGREVQARGERVVQHENIGFFGYFAGPKVHIVDLNALAEPLLARLPSRYNPDWRVGHYLRQLPAGYLETLQNGKECLLEDKNLCAYYEKLSLIIRGDLFSLSRFKAIVLMNFGAYDYLIDRDRYRHPELAYAGITELATPVPENAPFDGPGSRLISADGVRIALGQPSHASRLAISFDGNDQYEIGFYLADEPRGSVTAHSLHIGGMHTRMFDLPRKATSEGFDRIWVRPVSGDAKYAVGYLRLSP